MFSITVQVLVLRLVRSSMIKLLLMLLLLLLLQKYFIFCFIFRFWPFAEKKFSYQFFQCSSYLLLVQARPRDWPSLHQRLRWPKGKTKVGMGPRVRKEKVVGDGELNGRMRIRSKTDRLACFFTDEKLQT